MVFSLLKKSPIKPIEGKTVLFVIAPKNFRDEECFHTKEEIEKIGGRVVIASDSPGEKTGSLGGVATADLALGEVDSGDFDALVFVGGVGSMVYFDDKKAHKLAKEFYDADKVVAAICIAPAILAKAGILGGKQATAFSSADVMKILEAIGAKFTGRSVEVDGLIVTGNGPKAAREFGQKIAELLRED